MDIQRLPGFRDFYPEDCAFRNYIFDTWRSVATAFAFQEYDGPTLEPTDLYKRKSGDELKTQLLRFSDPGGRDVCLRPEMTPTAARLVAARERDFKKPIKWFSISPFFRFEKPQRGRLREFYQINCDIFGDNSAAADAELIALAIELHRAFGLSEQDFFVRLNNRNLWAGFLRERNGPEDRLTEFLAIIDKLERDAEEITKAKLLPFGLGLSEVRDFLRTPPESIPGFEPLLRELRWRGLERFVELDLTIVRGLDYYTGLVFELFDRKKANRSLAGGGRYDDLVRVISDGSVDLPAAGFAVGDLVLANLIEEIDHARTAAFQALERRRFGFFVVIADESRRPEALHLVSSLRRSGASVDFALQPAKVARQFQQAEAVGASHAIVVGQEWPEIRLKTLGDRTERVLSSEELCKNWKDLSGTRPNSR
jgi:histidyl-tRNA synthetase